MSGSRNIVCRTRPNALSVRIRFVAALIRCGVVGLFPDCLEGSCRSRFRCFLRGLGLRDAPAGLHFGAEPDACEGENDGEEPDYERLVFLEEINHALIFPCAAGDARADDTAGLGEAGSKSQLKTEAPETTVCGVEQPYPSL
ncbi:hypothetical protein [Streptomyces sp. GbtcB6]|uniref:hypothetical protein n=1 Tax=Streptomyces sp. GbtcB6 TaxID=2824751 RepID=UPI001C2F39B7|nr:hypothetical protein [Streptomyces sp. GbtcB6]